MASIVLIGPPGAGKTTVGKALSKKLNLKFVDTDYLIEQKDGRKIAEIFLESGEEAFRALEKQVVLVSLDETDAVISLGGGAVLDLDVQAKLSLQEKVIFLDVSISNAAPRVGFNRERPLLLGNPRQQWLGLMEKRRPIYESLATFTVNTDNRKAQEIADSLVETIKA
ncbi:MAG: hypothetical protein RLZZ159_613 [Actinomycetota bacterium]|jgi:shikimate kinase